MLIELIVMADIVWVCLDPQVWYMTEIRGKIVEKQHGEEAILQINLI